ncbi:MAG TPA: M14 family metallopeptidase [Rhodanobacteraceae bacterium]|nr:M14 family metallopeptidase [Rhodanobacteraceae bacterium]
MAVCHVAVTGRDRRHLTELATKLRVVVVGYREEKKGIVVDAYLPEEKIGWLKRHGYGVKALESVDAGDRKRQEEGRLSERARLKHGRYGDVIWGGGYLSADEVEAAIELGAKRHAGYFERIALPNLTWEKRRCHAIRIGTGDGKHRDAVCFVGGVHGREWGSPDILVYFAMRLLRAYRDRTPIRLGNKIFPAAKIRKLVETKDVILFPQVNPDGRRFSMERHPMWRKNRRPAPKGHGARGIGVDLNRNFPFLWRFDRHFAPNTVESSFEPTDYETYVGTRAASEPETRNVIWLLDRFPRIGYLIDLHSYGETILHNWGSDENQSDDPDMSFRNRRYDGKRGLIHDDLYREHIDASDLKEATRIGRKAAAAIECVRGRKYVVKQSVGLYPTAASTDDYAYSRHLVDPRKGKIIAFTMEWGRSRAKTPFHPPYAEMRKVMREVTAGLLEFCLQAK